MVEEIESNLPKKLLEGIKSSSDLKKMSPHQLLRIAKMLHIRYRNQLRNLMKNYAQLDAWLSMAKAMENFNLIFPTFINKENPVFVAKGLGHLLLENPVRYDIELNDTQHFLFLTGANMAGKSTFIKSIGTAVYMAHLGLGVACESMKLTLFDGILTNINIQDDLTKGESYFYQEVKRIKSTITTIDGGKKWLILIDELFKGTNMSDAINCSLLVIKGLLKRKNALYILSTHLYEISDSLKNEKGILFRYFETKIKNDEYEFLYRLLDGVSKDRLGLLILKKEGVVEMLNK
jgi:DNA mismatch repair ATPase MutS